MPKTTITRADAYQRHGRAMDAVFTLAHFANDYGFSELYNAFYANDFDPQRIADVIASYREDKMFMVTGGAKELYPIWCDAFGVQVKNEVTRDDLLTTVQMLATALESSFKGHSVRNAPHCFAAAEECTAGTAYEFRQNTHS